MVKQYPHILTCELITENSVLQDNGTWLKQQPGSTINNPCRYETSEIVREIHVADGKYLFPIAFV